MIQGFGFLNVRAAQQTPPMAWPQTRRGSEGRQVISKTPGARGEAPALTIHVTSLGVCVWGGGLGPGLF